jgi:hypothetical protein
VVQLVKTTSVSALVDHLLKTRFVSGADIRRQSESISWATIFGVLISVRLVVVASMSKDDDIIAGSLKMSLKCPVGVSSYFKPKSFFDVIRPPTHSSASCASSHPAGPQNARTRSASTRRRGTP